jgi:hypothetical protein
VLNGDFDWFRRQANAIERGGLPQRAQFNAKVVYLLEYAMCKTLGRPENWRPPTNAERKAFLNVRRVPEVVTLTPAGKVTDATTRDIYNILEKRFLSKEGKDKDDENGPQVVEGYQFKNKNRVMDEIRELAKRLQVELKKKARKR